MKDRHCITVKAMQCLLSDGQQEAWEKMPEIIYLYNIIRKKLILISRKKFIFF